MTYIHPIRIYLCENGVRLGQVKEWIATFDWFHLDVMKACNSLKRFEDIFHCCWNRSGSLQRRCQESEGGQERQTLKLWNIKRPSSISCNMKNTWSFAVLAAWQPRIDSDFASWKATRLATFSRKPVTNPRKTQRLCKITKDHKKNLWVSQFFKFSSFPKLFPFFLLGSCVFHFRHQQLDSLDHGRWRTFCDIGTAELLGVFVVSISFGQLLQMLSRQWLLGRLFCSCRLLLFPKCISLLFVLERILHSSIW